MKLFLQEHLSLILLQIIQVCIMIGLLLLANYRDIQMILYLTFMSFFLFTIYLFYMYMTRKNYYKKLTTSVGSLDESLEQIGTTPVAEQLQQLLKSQYNLYADRLLTEQKKQDQYNMFLDRWLHQMKTPVSVLHLMAKDLDEPEASDLQEEVDRLQRGLEMVLHMARVRTIEHDFHIQRLSLMEMLQDVIKENRRLFIRQEIYPRIKETNDYIVETDEKWFQFILTQLIQNAVKYSVAYGKYIDIGLGEVDGRSMVEIRDEGVGIPKEDLKRIFNPFFTGENGRTFRESTGIGLYLVKEVLTHLGHDIKVVSERGVGTTFTIYF